MSEKVCLRCKGKTLLGVVNKLFVLISLLTTPSNCLPLHLKQTFPPIIWIFTQGEEDEIESKLNSYIFSTLAQITASRGTLKLENSQWVCFQCQRQILLLFFVIDLHGWMTDTIAGMTGMLKMAARGHWGACDSIGTALQNIPKGCSYMWT